MNQTTFSKENYSKILALFPVVWHDKLRMYTGEELYYTYRLCKFKPRRDRETGDIRGGDVTYMALRAKQLRYLKGLEKYPIYPTAWEKLGRIFRYGFESEFGSVEPLLEGEII